MSTSWLSANSPATSILAPPRYRFRMEAVHANAHPFADLVAACSSLDFTVARPCMPEVEALVCLQGIEEKNGERYGYNNMCYYEHEIKRIAKVAFDIAMKRGKKVCSVDKANVLDVSQLWRDVVIEESKNYPEVPITRVQAFWFRVLG